VEWREKVGVEKRKAFRDEEYWAKPVPGFGDENARVMVLGLAPGAHGSNRTGRMFTGDDSGRFLYTALHKAGFASKAISVCREDDLSLIDVWITAICRCVPPGNKPNTEEIRNCRSFLTREQVALHHLQGIVALGKFAYDAAIEITQRNRTTTKFGHGVFIEGNKTQPWILASYLSLIHISEPTRPY
jgi:uracil-DNA glycosylase family 4